jgi:hypothetical protein
MTLNGAGAVSNDHIRTRRHFGSLRCTARVLRKEVEQSAAITDGFAQVAVESSGMPVKRIPETLTL